MAPDFRPKLDYSHVLATPNDGKRYELVQGELFVDPAPNRMHQRISRRLQRQLEDYFHDRRLGEVFNAPLDVILTPHDVFEPDLLVVGDPADTTDRGVKFRGYAELGIQNCWIVDPERKRMECFRATSGTYRLVIAAEGDRTLHHPDWDGLVIDLAALWLQSPFS